MGKKLKAGNAGLAATFLSRSACLKRLQITLKDFRRLCILKGIYPRQPHKTPTKVKGQTYYHIRDITYISHEPLLESFREFKAYMKKVRKVAGKNSKDEALRMSLQKPSYTLHHLVKERYPRFQDALGDLDDAISMITLFAQLPSTGKIKGDTVERCRNLARSWSAYVATTNSLTKAFVSVKGIYFEAKVMGVEVRWVVPHAFTQNLPQDVDFRVMSTFVEFYEVLLNFVLYKLYNGINLNYPVKIVEEIKDDGGIVSLLGVLKDGKGGNVIDAIDTAAATTAASSSSKKVAKKASEDMDIDAIVGDAGSDNDDEEDDDSDNDEDDDVNVGEGLTNALMETVAVMKDGKLEDRMVGEDLSENDTRKSLFSGLTFFISREVPRHIVELVALSYGARVGWEGKGSSIVATDPTITHFIMDRPSLPATYKAHPKNREYVQPQWTLDSANFGMLLPVTKYGVGATLPPHLSPWVDNEKEGYTPRYAEEVERMKKGEEIYEEDKEGDRAEDGEESEDEVVPEAAASDSDDEEEDEEKADAEQKKKKEARMDDPKELAKGMMSKKAARLYGRMQHGLNERQSFIDNLEAKRATIEKEEKDAAKAEKKRKIVIVSKDEEEKIDMMSKSGLRRVEQKIEGRIKVDGKTAKKQKSERLATERVAKNKEFAKEIKNIEKDQGNKRSAQKAAAKKAAKKSRSGAQ
jgi:pescadillo protein